jgi:hypothetical protein
MQKARARDKSDYDMRLKGHQKQITANHDRLDVHGSYLDTFAQVTSMMIENINM